jgi:hypothetical protein
MPKAVQAPGAHRKCSPASLCFWTSGEQPGNPAGVKISGKAVSTGAEACYVGSREATVLSAAVRTCRRPHRRLDPSREVPAVIAVAAHRSSTFQ